MLLSWTSGFLSAKALVYSWKEGDHRLAYYSEVWAAAATLGIIVSDAPFLLYKYVYKVVFRYVTLNVLPYLS
jgi:hypothetical protein